VTLSGYPFPPSLRSSGFILSVSDGLKWWSWRLMPRLINTFSFSVFFCSLCLRSGDKSKAGNAGFLLSPLFFFVCVFGLPALGTPGLFPFLVLPSVLFSGLSLSTLCLFPCFFSSSLFSVSFFRSSLPFVAFLCGLLWLL
jgi:hypothetical protein